MRNDTRCAQTLFGFPRPPSPPRLLSHPIILKTALLEHTFEGIQEPPYARSLLYTCLVSTDLWRCVITIFTKQPVALIPIHLIAM